MPSDDNRDERYAAETGSGDDAMDRNPNASGDPSPAENEGDNDRPSEEANKGGNGGSDESRGDVGDLSLMEQLEAARSERDAHYDQMLRARADLENYRKRVQREHEEVRLYQALPLIRDLLPALDNLERALQAARDSGSADELAQGVEMVKKQIEETLARYSVVSIEAVGQPFDPNLHEAVQQVPSDEHPRMTVVEELQRGFKMHDRVVRPSKVIVSAGPPEKETE